MPSPSLTQTGVSRSRGRQPGGSGEIVDGTDVDFVIEDPGDAIFAATVPPLPRQTADWRGPMEKKITLSAIGGRDEEEIKSIQIWVNGNELKRNSAGRITHFLAGRTAGAGD